MSNNTNANNKTTNDAPDMLIDVFGAKTFFKVYQALGIGKIKFSFVDKENPKENSIDYYLDADVFSCDLIEQINNGELRQKGNAERKRAKEAKDKYCKAIWNSPPGASSDQKKLRQFEIQPGNSTEFVFRATETPNTQQEPTENDQQAQKKNIIVGCDYRSLRLLAERWKYLKSDYDELMRRKYCLENMQSAYRRGNEASASMPTTAPVQTEKPKEQSVSTPQTQTPQETSAPTTPQAKPIGVGMGTTPQAPAQETEPTTPTPQENNQQTQEFRMKITTPIADMANGKKALKAVTFDNIEYPLIFSAELVKRGEFSEFEKRCGRAGNVIKVRGAVGKNGDTDVIFVASFQ